MGRSHPINNRVWRSHLVPPAPKTLVFMGWDGPTSSHLLPNPQFSWYGTIPPRPTCSQNPNFHGVKRSHLVPLVPKPPIFMGWDGPTLSHLLPNPQCHRVERSHLVPPAPKPLIFMGWDSPTSSHAIAVSGQLDSRQLPQARQRAPPHPTCSQCLVFRGVGWSHYVPPAAKPSGFTRWDGPTSSHLLPNPQFL